MTTSSRVGLCALWVVVAPAWAADAVGPSSGWPSPVSPALDASGFEQPVHGTFERFVGDTRTTLSADGLVLRRGDEEVVVRLASWGRAGHWLPLEPVEPAWGGGPASQRAVVLDHPGLMETWRSVPGGLEHSWTLTERPAGSGVLGWQVQIGGAAGWTVDPDGDGARVASRAGRSWRYDGLRAWDAAGRSLDTWMVSDAAGLWVRLDDSGAVYPITVDPLVSEESKLFASDGVADDLFGFALSGAGDVNGDGYDDVIVGAKRDDDLGVESGSIYIYLGSPTGLDPSSELKITASDGVALDNFGYAAAGAGDVNGDGYDDVVAGIRFDGGGVGSGPGAAYVYLGSALGIDPATEVKLTASDGGPDDYFGMSAAGAGDVDGDGYDDLIVGARWDDTNGADAGAAYLYLGGPSGVDASTELKLVASDGGAGDLYGLPVTTAGDVDGDGYADVIVGAHEGDGVGVDTGAAYIYLGGPAGIDPLSEIKLTASDAVSDERFGWPVTSAGDVDGDGYGDVVIGANFDDDHGTWSGSAYVFHGDASGIDLTSETKLVAADSAPRDFFGKGVTATDLDADGYSDVVVGAFGSDDNGSMSGAAYVFPGGPGGVDPTVQMKLLADDGTSNDWFGWWMAAAGDLNGDQFGDLIVAASGDGAPKRGSAYLFYGGVRLEASVSGVCPGVLDVQVTGATAGGEVALFTAAGAGTSVVAAGPCAGVLSSLAGPVAFRGLATADASGRALLSPGVPAAGCGTSLQVLDLASCTLSDVGSF